MEWCMFLNLHQPHHDDKHDRQKHDRQNHSSEHQRAFRVNHDSQFHAHIHPIHQIENHFRNINRTFLLQILDGMIR